MTVFPSKYEKINFLNCSRTKTNKKIIKKILQPGNFSINNVEVNKIEWIIAKTKSMLNFLNSSLFTITLFSKTINIFPSNMSHSLCYFIQKYYPVYWLVVVGKKASCRELEHHPVPYIRKTIPLKALNCEFIELSVWQSIDFFTQFLLSD